MRIVLADDQPKVRLALRLLLECEQGVDVVGEAADAESLLAQVKTACPDVVLLSYELPGLATVDMLPLLRRVCPDLRVIALSGRPEARQAATYSGADAFVSKGDPPERLLMTIRSVDRT